MNMEKPPFPVFESTDNKIKNEINTKLSELLKQGVLLDDIVELLDAQEFLEHIETGKRHSDVAHFDVDGFIKKRTSENRKFSLPEEYIKIDETILPPSELEPKTGAGNGGFKEAGIIPRSTMLMETLTEMKLKYSVIEGKNDPRMVRKLSYFIFDIPSIQKLVLVNDEEGNATFIIHKAREEEWKNYMKMTKSELSEMSYDIVSSFNYPNKEKEGHEERWKEKIKDILIHGTPEGDTAPNGWEKFSHLAKELKADINTVKRYAEKYRSENPEWFGTYKNKYSQSGLAEYYSPELAEKIKKDYLSIESMPEGWMTLAPLAKLANVACETVKRDLEEYIVSNPDWFKIYRKKGGRVAEHVSPELVKIIKEKYEIQSAPEGWMTIHTLSDSVKATIGAIRDEAEKFRQSSPEWFKVFRNVQNKIKEHCSPELVKIITTKYKETLYAPNGWLTLNALARKIGLDPITLKKYAEEYRQTYAEQFKEYRIERSGTFREHISPQLVEILTEKYGKIELAPEGWKTAMTVSREIDAGVDVIRKFSEPYRNEHQDWFKIYKNRSGQTLEHYHPALVSIIKKEIEKSENIPDGWSVMYKLAEDLGVAQGTVKDYVENYRVEHPEWFKIFKSQRGYLSEHVSPEIKQLATEYFKQFKSIPEGWQNIESIMKEIGISKATVRKSAQARRQEHPEWFRMHEDSIGRREMYYHPDLIVLLKNEFKDNNQAPSGWLTLTPIMESIRSDFRTVKRVLDSHKEEHPDWFKNFRDSKGEIREHYSPELVATVEKKYTPTPENWMMPNKLATLLKTDPRKVREFAEKYRGVNPEWFKEYRGDSKAGLKEHYSSELVEILKNELSKNNKK